MNIFDTDSIFTNVGPKIQAVAKWAYLVCTGIVLVGAVIGVIASFLSGSFLLFLLSLIAIALCVVVYILAAMISSWYIHGFGVLVEKAEMDLDRNAASKRASSPWGASRKCEMCGTVIASDAKFCACCGNAVGAAPLYSVSVKDGWKCPSCSRMNPKYQTTCSCGARKPQATSAASHKWMCDGCGQMRSKTPCEHCGKE